MIREALKKIGDDMEQKPDTRHEAQALADTMDHLETALLCDMWNAMLARLNTTNKTVQAANFYLKRWLISSPRLQHSSKHCGISLMSLRNAHKKSQAHPIRKHAESGNGTGGMRISGHLRKPSYLQGISFTARLSWLPLTR